MARKGGNPDLAKYRNKFTTETSRKALEKRKANADSRKKLLAQVDAIVDLITAKCSEGEFVQAVSEAPNQLLRTYGKEFQGDRAVQVMELILDRVLGRPKQAVENKTEVKADEGFQLVVSSATSRVLKKK